MRDIPLKSQGFFESLGEAAPSVIMEIKSFTRPVVRTAESVEILEFSDDDIVALACYHPFAGGAEVGSQKSFPCLSTQCGLNHNRSRLQFSDAMPLA